MKQIYLSFFFLTISIPLSAMKQDFPEQNTLQTKLLTLGYSKTDIDDVLFFASKSSKKNFNAAYNKLVQAKEHINSCKRPGAIKNAQEKIANATNYIESHCIIKELKKNQELEYKSIQLENEGTRIINRLNQLIHDLKMQQESLNTLSEEMIEFGTWIDNKIDSYKHKPVLKDEINVPVDLVLQSAGRVLIQQPTQLFLPYSVAIELIADPIIIINQPTSQNIIVWFKNKVCGAYAWCIENPKKVIGLGIGIGVLSWLVYTNYSKAKDMISFSSDSKANNIISSSHNGEISDAISSSVKDYIHYFDVTFKRMLKIAYAMGMSGETALQYAYRTAYSDLIGHIRWMLGYPAYNLASHIEKEITSKITVILLEIKKATNVIEIS